MPDETVAGGCRLPRLLGHPALAGRECDAELAAYFAGEPAPAQAPQDERWLFADSHYWGRALSGLCRMRAR